MTAAPQQENMTPIYGHAASIYLQYGWKGPLLLPVRKKADPKKGFSGYSGVDPDYATIMQWATESPYGNIGLRMPETVIGWDEDSYSGRLGSQTRANLEAQLGPLPATWVSTSREDGTGSGIKFFRVPPGIHFVSDLGDQSGVEIVRRQHRYAVVWPSIHPDTGGTYRWYAPGWVPSLVPPSPTQLAELPATWVQYLTKKQMPDARPPAINGQVVSGDSFFIEERRFTYQAASNYCDKEMRTLAATKEGGRNNALNNAAKILSHFIPDFWSEDEARTWLYGALDPSYPHIEAEATITSAFKSAAKDWKATRVDEAPPAWTPNTQAIEPTRSAQDHYKAPLECLPPLMYQFVTGTSTQSQIVPEMALLAALCSVSYVTGGNVLVDLNGYYEPVVIWSVLAAEPSERKSSALRAAAKNPLKAAVAEFWAGVADEQAQIKDKLGIEKEKHKKLKAALAGESKDMQQDLDEHRLDEHRRNIADLESQMISKPIWSVTDSTTEGLETAMVETDGAVASFTDEAALLSTIAGRYAGGRGISLGSLNQAWSNESIFVLRQSQRRQVDKPFAVLCQFIQPGPFTEIMAALRREEDGFLSRWLFCDPALYGPRTSYTQPPDHQTRARWVCVLTALLKRFWPQKQPTVLSLSADAWAVYHEVFAQIDVDQRSYNKVNPAFAQWLGKGPNGHIVRVAALFELIHDQQAQEISGEAMRRAVHLFWWLRAEALKAMHTTGGEAMRSEVEREILSWIAKRRAKDREVGVSVFGMLTARELQRGPRRFRTLPKGEIDAILTQLEDQRWLEHSKDDRLVWIVRTDFDDKWAEQSDG